MQTRHEACGTSQVASLPEQRKPDPSGLCSHCLEHGIPELLRKLKTINRRHRPHLRKNDNIQRQPARSSDLHFNATRVDGDGEHRPISGGTAEEIDVSFSQEAIEPKAADTTTKPGFGLSCTIGGSGTFSMLKSQIDLGSAESLLSRTGCPICELVAHVLPSEYGHELSQEGIQLNLSNNTSPRGPGILSLCRANHEFVLSRGKYELYVLAGHVTLGRIQFHTSNRANAMESADHDKLHGPMRDSWHYLPEDTINTVLSMRDDVEAVRNF